jgi:hypothetical protein
MSTRRRRIMSNVTKVDSHRFSDAVLRTTLVLGLAGALSMYELAAGVHGQAGDRGQVVVTLAVAKQQPAPLRIIGFILPERVSDGPRLVVENYSSSEVTAFWGALLVGRADATDRAPDGKTDSVVLTNIGIRNEGWPRIPAIPPRTQTEVPQDGLRLPDLAYHGREAAAACLHVTILVTRVHYADGTIWRLDDVAGERRVWSDSLSRESARACAGRRTPNENVLRHLEGWGYEKDPGSPTHATSERLTSYSFACPVRQLRNKLVVVCPF